MWIKFFNVSGDIMSEKREALREKAKKVYKEEIKKLPKRQRPTFAMFFKHYVERLKHEKIFNPTIKEDFNFEEIISVNQDTDTTKKEE